MLPNPSRQTPQTLALLLKAEKLRCDTSLTFSSMLERTTTPVVNHQNWVLKGTCGAVYVVATSNSKVWLR